MANPSKRYPYAVEIYIPAPLEKWFPMEAFKTAHG